MGRYHSWRNLGLEQQSVSLSFPPAGAQHPGGAAGGRGVRVRGRGDRAGGAASPGQRDRARRVYGARWRVGRAEQGARAGGPGPVIHLSSPGHAPATGDAPGPPSSGSVARLLFLLEHQSDSQCNAPSPLLPQFPTKIKQKTTSLPTRLLWEGKPLI